MMSKKIEKKMSAIPSVYNIYITPSWIYVSAVFFFAIIKKKKKRRMYSNNALNRWNSTPIENELRGRKKKKETNKMGGGLYCFRTTGSDYTAAGRVLE